jgi:hypothetical protein
MIRTTLLPLALLALVACVQDSTEVAATTPDPGESSAAAAASNRVDIPAAVRKNLGITFAEVELRDLERTLRVPGSFELEPLARHEYRMALPGRVQLLVDQYERVEPGTVLYRYSSPAWPELLHEVLQGEQAERSARAEIAVAQAALDEAERGLELARERIEALAQAEFKRADLEVAAAGLEASLPRLGAELELARARLVNAESTRRHALHRAAVASGMSEAALEAEVPGPDGAPVPRWQTIDQLEVRAVEPGVVEALAVTDGAFLEPPAVVLATVDPSRVRFRALALQADLGRLDGALVARIVPAPSPGADAGAGVLADLAVGLEAHPEERTIPLVATPREAAPWVRSGVSAFLEVVLEGGAGPVLAVPDAAVVRDGLVHVLFRRDPANPNQAIRIEADLGVSDGRWVELASGVMRGDQVVLDGVHELRLVTQQSGGSQAGGHFHADGSFHDEH